MLAGCFSDDGENDAIEIIGGESPVMNCLEQYRTNSEEADCRIWRHATQSTARKMLICSPDTDIYNIGLNYISSTSKHYIIKINAYSAIETSFIDLPNLHHALTNDPDLASVPRAYLANILQTLFICTGCDYVSFFKKVGKATFFNYFFQHAFFICGGNAGSLYETNLATRSNGFLAFIRLVGTVYFKKHLPSFVSLYGHETPDHSFNSIDQSLDPHQRHQMWFERIREVVSDRIQCEEERIPSYTSLWRHWMKSCWISTMWRNSHTDDLYTNLPHPHLNGWLLSEDGLYSIDWEDEKVKSEIEKHISVLLKGCKCKTKCGMRCGCRKKQAYCGPGCECQECQNLPVQNPGNAANEDNETDVISESEESDEEETETTGDIDIIDTEIITETDYFTLLTTENYII